MKLKKKTKKEILQKMHLCNLELDCIQREIHSYGMLFDNLEYTSLDAGALSGIGLNLNHLSYRLEKIHNKMEKLNDYFLCLDTEPKPLDNA